MKYVTEETYKAFQPFLKLMESDFAENLKTNDEKISILPIIFGFLK